MSWDRAVGMTMIAASIGVVAAMGHHPSGAHSGSLGAIVHGSMIALLLLWTWGFFHFAQRLGVQRPLVLAGIITYAVSAMVHLTAGTINGFIVPPLAGRGVTDHDLFLLAWLTNQAFAKLGVYMTGAAYSLWSVELLSKRDGRSRWLGALGLVVGIGPAALLATGAIEMRVEGAFLIYSAHAIWAVLVGVALIRRPLSGEVSA